MRYGVVGSRSFTDERYMYGVLTALMGSGSLECVVSGGAAGVDTMAKRFADQWGIPTSIHHPAGPGIGALFERNTRIVDDCEALLAFFGPGEPKSMNKGGTIDTVKKAIAHRIPVHLYFQAAVD